MTSQEVINSCDRAIAGAQELKAAATQMQQSDQQIREKQSILASLESKIAQAQQLASQLQEVDQQVRRKQAALAELDAEIARKNEKHGSITNALRDLGRQITGDPQHA